ncbi:protein ADM2 [Rhineura floridana]|uniref:protein ADM2 n=1 Tax=Rhineura floridana TaxID=261503 RepID=UPI002AC81368|nr:protein ADM2 [Rhineura floridana]
MPQLRAESSCISRRLLRPPFLLLLLFHLLGFEAAESSTSVRSGHVPQLLSPRMPSAISHRAAWLQKRLITKDLSYNTDNTWLARKQPVVAPSSQLHLHVLLTHGLDPQRPSSHPLHQLLRATVQRQKRHAAARLHHAQLMRVGCALGTCQVQNLSHRLWQLKGQSGRQDSSPINPNSPHSYG